MMYLTTMFCSRITIFILAYIAIALVLKYILGNNIDFPRYLLQVMEIQANKANFLIDSMSIAALKDGRLAVVWDSYQQDGSRYGIYCQLLDETGNVNGSEFRVNTYTIDHQQHPMTTSLTNGHFVAVWQSFKQDGSSWGIYAQIFYQNGSAFGPEFRVNNYTQDQQDNPSITSMENGGFIIAWESYQQDGSDFGIFAQLYSGNGSIQGAEFQVNNYTAAFQGKPAITSLKNGDFVIVWTSNSQEEGLNWGVYGRIYYGNGTIKGNEFRVNNQTPGTQGFPAIASLKTGGFVVVYQSDMEGFGWGIYRQIYDENGIIQGLELRVNTETVNDQFNPRIASLKNGKFVVVWQSNEQDGSGAGVYGQMYNENGTVYGTEFRVNTYIVYDQLNQSIISLDNGGFAVIWKSYRQSNSYLGIYGQNYDENGAAVGTQFRINPNPMYSLSNPSTSFLPSGGVVIIWQSDAQDGSIGGIFGGIYYENGTLKNNFRVNNYTDNDQTLPSIACLKNGSFVVVWQSIDQDGYGAGIYGQMFNENGTRYGTEFRVNNYTSYDQLSPAITSLKNGGFAVVWKSHGQDQYRLGNICTKVP